VLYSGEGRVVQQNYAKNKTTISKKKAFVDNKINLVSGNSVWFINKESPNNVFLIIIAGRV
jgi:hypothetical protein